MYTQKKQFPIQMPQIPSKRALKGYRLIMGHYKPVAL
jgi:hypothetical protein